MLALAWMALFAPLAACVVITLGTLKHRRISSAVACAGITASLALSIAVFVLAWLRDFETAESNLILVSLTSLRLEFGVILDRLSCLMLLLVTGVGSAIFYYSLAYMRDDAGRSRYFAGLSFFAFSMLGIVLSTNFFQMFIFWELVGAASYLLIGHWYEKQEAADAGKKAFLTTRVGDVGFLVGILMLWSWTGSLGRETLGFGELRSLLETSAAGTVGLSWIGLLIFCGVLGKSAQFPLHVWLPDAMEGPTPVSALIHAATMVAAGVYLLARTFFLFTMAPAVLWVIASVGVLTAFLAATMALVQDDIKKILAYSTLSQLGYMVMAVGLGSSGAAMYHLATHAFFKALLFLGAGSVLHALRTQNIWEMGALMRRMPVTGGTFLIGFLALAGIFPFSGFWSKDEILSLALSTNRIFYGIGVGTAFLTSLYMGRLFFTVFVAEPSRPVQAHEGSWAMTLPLLALAFFATAGGFLGIGTFLHAHEDRPVSFDFTVMGTSLTLSLAGIFLAYLMYGMKIPLFAGWQGATSRIRKVLVNKYYMDDLYDLLVRTVQQNLALVCDLFERTVVVGFVVNGTARLTGLAGHIIRFLQTGKVQAYALVLTAGVTLLTYWLAIR